jgi:hypothetical protein
MRTRAFTELVTTFAQEVGAIVWDGIPSGGATVVWTGDSKSFLNKVRRLNPAVVYLSPDVNSVAVAAAGVVHIFDADVFEESIRLGFETAMREMVVDSDELDSSVATGGSMVLQLQDDDDEYDEDDPDGPLRPDLQDLAFEIAMNERFDGFSGSVSKKLIKASGLDPVGEFRFRIEEEAQEIFKSIAAQFEWESRAIVKELLKHPEFDPLLDRFSEDGEYPYVDEALLGKDFRLRRLVLAGLAYEVFELGLDGIAERELRQAALQLRANIPPIVLDQVGFATLRAVRAALLEPFLGAVAPRRREVTGDWIKRLEGRRAQERREARYAHAAHRLLTGTATKKRVAEQLQLSISTLDRLLKLPLPAGFELGEKDPIIVELAPELRQ